MVEGGKNTLTLVVICDRLEPDDTETASLLMSGPGGSRAYASSNPVPPAEERGGGLSALADEHEAPAKESRVHSTARVEECCEEKTQVLEQCEQLHRRCVYGLVYDATHSHRSLGSFVVRSRVDQIVRLARSGQFTGRVTWRASWVPAATALQAATAWHTC